MSISNRNTKVATVIQYWADCPEEMIPCGDNLRFAHEIGSGFVKIETTCGFVKWGSHTPAVWKGDRVVLKRTCKGAAWRLTGHA